MYFYITKLIIDFERDNSYLYKIPHISSFYLNYFSNFFAYI